MFTERLSNTSSGPVPPPNLGDQTIHGWWRNCEIFSTKTNGAPNPPGQGDVGFGEVANAGNCFNTMMEWLRKFKGIEANIEQDVLNSNAYIKGYVEGQSGDVQRGRACIQGGALEVHRDDRGHSGMRRGRRREHHEGSRLTQGHTACGSRQRDKSLFRQ
jgi:hypothetical protein